MAARGADSLAAYRAKRRFEETPEPAGRAARRGRRGYVIQKHDARRLHYDFRLELDGVLKSWAVPKGPSLDPAVKRLAVRTEDHPVEYATFEGRIPAGNYGAGTVLLWDRGTWQPVGDAREGLAAGKLVFRLDGERLSGHWALVRMGAERGRENWLLIKEADDDAEAGAEPTEAHLDSVASGRAMAAIAAAPEALWTSDEGRKDPPGAGRRRKGAAAKRPAFVEPALATLVDRVPSGDDWVFEMKLDGYRAIAACAGDDVAIYTRSGLDWTHRYPNIAEALVGLRLPGVLLDGEIVAVDERGRHDFGALQHALREDPAALSYFVFDLLAESGTSLRRRPLIERKTRLRALLGEAGRPGPVYFADHIDGHGQAMLDQLCDAGYEGVIAKRKDASYRSGRGRAWLKIKCGTEQEFVIVGWSPSTRGRPFASLVLAVREGGALRYAGRVGAGFSERQLDELARRFRPAKRKPVTGAVPADIAKRVRWVRPELVAQIAFAGFTRDGLVRQARFLGLREDKPAAAVVRERPVPSSDGDDDIMEISGIRLTHPDKVLFPDQGATKADLARYADKVADRMLPYVEKRLLTLLRCPDGRTKSCFVQRHAGSGLPDAFHEHEVKEKDGSKRRYLYIDGREGLIAAVQMGVLELHIWGSRIDRIERPERIVFDLDPDPGIDFAAVKQAAFRVRDVLDALDLESFALVTGGKGIHVVVPIERRHDWPEVKAFAEAVAKRMVEDDPDRYVATMRKAKRKNRIFIDYFRNDRSATAIAPYSVRNRPGAPLAWPVTWRQLDKVEAANVFTLDEAAKLLKRADPWRGYGDVRQSVKARARRALGL